MFSAIFYKEWIKTRRTVGLMLLLLVALLVYALVQMGQTLRVSGAVQAWSAVLLKDISLVPAVTKWFTLLTGVLLGVAQFIPEMTDKRLKLTLHLPLRESKIVFVTLLYGIAVLSAAFLLMYVSLYAVLSRHYAAEMLHAMTWQLLPYFEGGLACYLFYGMGLHGAGMAPACGQCARSRGRIIPLLYECPIRRLHDFLALPDPYTRRGT